MKIKLNIHFETDGDFCFLGLDNLIDTKSNLYNGVIKKFKVTDKPDYEKLDILLECEGDANCCRWAARDVLENLITGGFRVVHYYLVEDLYKLIITPREEMLWLDTDVHYQDTLSGNYEGTVLKLDIIH